MAENIKTGRQAWGGAPGGHLPFTLPSPGLGSSRILVIPLAAAFGAFDKTSP